MATRPSAADRTDANWGSLVMEGKADYGTLNFTRSRREAKAQYLRVPTDMPATTTLDFMQSQWSLAEPGLLLHVTGSAQDFHMAERVSGVAVNAVTEGIVHATSVTNAWLLTGGLDAGVMALVGSAVARFNHRCTVPVVGVASWKGVLAREGLSPNRGEKRKYCADQPSTPKAAALEPNHTHFLLVDKVDHTTGSPWGHEIATLEVSRPRARARRRERVGREGGAAAAAGRGGGGARGGRGPVRLWLACHSHSAGRASRLQLGPAPSHPYRVRRRWRRR